MRRVLLALLPLALLAPTAAAEPVCATPEACLPVVEVCPALAPWLCLRVDPEVVEVLDLERVRELLGPCTCDPVD